ncbi:uncharacterized protein LOC107041789 [Diachasma alloeum]|uniref:uncharacterized protein LOC107041789 n=1 Tax=Diachasma alloeum TaxID=454923 RepID=UPI0007382168|nr:uncharacterized protein LOC107041789 [Diachasma alloeum]
MFRLKFFVLSVILTIELVNSRVLYLDTPRSNYYPVYPDEAGTEQASRDLDVTFSAGESGETEEQVYPPRKTIIYPPSERSIYDLGSDLDRPIYYRAPEFPVRRILYAEPPSERNHKLMRLNNPHKGEVVLELRVIANNNNGI